MLGLLALFILAQFVAADCPAGYDDNGSGTCYKVYTTIKNRIDATKACQADGGYLANVPNQITNTMLYSTAKSLGVQSIWIGLTCQADTATSCQFDGTTTFLTQNSFTNFFPGQPASEVGTCIFMSTVGGTLGKWFSADCTSDNTAYACSYTGTAPNTGCSAGYTLFNNQCYRVIGPTDEVSAESQCVSECGYITDVFSGYENTFVKSLAQNQTITGQPQLFVRIGLKTSDGTNYFWEDGVFLSANSYSNFGSYGRVPALGNCVGVALTDEMVLQGQWLNTKCSDSMISVCKKEKGYVCSVVTTSSPTMAPVYCTAAYWYKNNGTFYSPGYPQKAVANTCDYLLYTDPGYIIKLTFSILLLRCTSQIELYNDFADTVPFKTITPSTGSTFTYYASSENEMKIIYHSSGCGSGDLWEATFTSQYVGISTTQLPVTSSGCNNGLIYAPGTITSPNYPNLYNSNTECNYLLGAVANKRVQLHFNFFSTEQGVDLVKIYDSDTDDKNKVIAVLSGNQSNLSDYFSTGARMFVRFTSDSLGNFQGFSASFVSY